MMMAHVSIVLFMLLLGVLLLPVTATAAAETTHSSHGNHYLRELRPRTRHSNTPTTTTTTTSADGTTVATNATSPHAQSTNATTTSTEPMTNTTSTLPDACLPTTESCLDKLRPLADMAHNITADVMEKDNALDEFCHDACGQNYTKHITAILKGMCVEALPPRMNASLSSGSGITVVVHHAPGVVVVTNNTRIPINDEEEDENEEGEDNEQNEGQTAPQTQEDIWNRFQQDRPGTALGCVTATDGHMCAAKQGCDFFNSCCYASWVRLGNAAGFPLSMRTVRAVEFFCPGSLRYLEVDGCT